jgi:hypothetical protein
VEGSRDSALGMMIIIKIFSGLLLINAALVVAWLERIADLFAYSD